MDPEVVSDGSIEGNADDMAVAEKERLWPRMPWMFEQDLIFMDVEAMRAKVHEAKTSPVYNVSDYYHDSGIFQRVARSSIFENASLTVVALNALWIAVEADYNQADMLCHAHLAVQVIEHAFCAVFSIELAIRAMAFKRKRSALRDHWFTFDLLLVTMMVLETWVWSSYMCAIAQGGANNTAGSASTLRLIRLLRLTRMARMAKLLRAMPELMIMIKGMVAAMRSVFFTLCLLVISLYIFAIAVKQMSDGTDSGGQHFSSVPHSMYTLLVRATLLDSIGKLLNEVSEDSTVVATLIVIFVFLAAFTVMNMLIGVLCEVVSAVAVVEREEMAVNNVHDKLKSVLNGIDADGNNYISKHEFKQIVENPSAITALQAVDVDVVGLVELADIIFAAEPGEDDVTKEISFEEFVELALQMRNTNQSTVKDILNLQKLMKINHFQMAAAFELNDARLTRIEESLNVITKVVARESEPTPFPWRMQKKRHPSKRSTHSDGDTPRYRSSRSPSASPASASRSRSPAERRSPTEDGRSPSERRSPTERPRAHVRAARSAGAALSHMVGAISNLTPWSRDDNSPMSFDEGEIQRPFEMDMKVEGNLARESNAIAPFIDIESGRTCSSAGKVDSRRGSNAHCKRPPPILTLPSRQRRGTNERIMRNDSPEASHVVHNPAARPVELKHDERVDSHSPAETYAHSPNSVGESISEYESTYIGILDKAQMILPGTPVLDFRNESFSSKNH
eukprot:TRINITY_DN32590_c0_g1_i1.p1 TRINITY_DN32590_c0_g1~~TRINITY_DN32590_c0_g1_i1.p1  ORF type:complete len:736 (-),score=107.72 TRINITY_DN32590_c0_g1_i1:131-2338(-)